MSGKLSLFVDPAWRRDADLHTPILYPFWGNTIGDSSLFAKEMFTSFPYDTSVYTITDDVHRADMVLAPYRHLWLLEKAPRLLDECARVARAADKPLLIDGAGDVERPVDIPRSIVLRIGGYRFIPEERRIIVPPASDDLLFRCVGDEFLPRGKHAGKPTVGFAGWANLTLSQRIRTILKETPIRIRAMTDSRYAACTKGVLWRERALRILAASDAVNLDARPRKTFSGTTKTAQGDMRALRQELVDTVLRSDLALDVRGDANASTRLFEIMSLGRVPLMVDTERNLPFKDVVDYGSFCVIVDYRNIRELPDRAADFYARVSDDDFAAMQSNARAAFVSHLRTDAIMRGVVRELRGLLG